MKSIILTISLLSLILAGCEESASSFTYDKKVVVTSLLESGRSIDTVKLMYTGEVDKKYHPGDYAITNASVKIYGVDVAFEDSLVYDPSNPGRYHSLSTVKKIEPRKTYRLEARMPDGSMVSAVTTVPDTFSIMFSTLPNNGTVRYNTGAPVNFFAWSPSDLHGTYLPTITSLDSNAARIPKSFIRDTVEVPAPDKVGFRVGLPKEQNYTELPWIFIGYFGTTRFDVFAIDGNYTNFLNQYVGSQGGELKGIRYNIQGGIGYFGSRTKAKGAITIYLTP